MARASISPPASISSELTERDTAEGVEHSRMWHRAFQHIEFGQVPVVAVLHGAVVGGGLELAAAAHIRVAERSAYYALPEGSRGIFVGGGASVRLPRLIGVARMMDMMLTGRTYGAEEGQAIGLSQYLVDDGKGLAKGIELAERIASNAPLTNFAVIHVLPRIAESDPASGYLDGVADGGDRARQRRGQGEAPRVSGEARRQGDAWLVKNPGRSRMHASAAPLRPVRLGPADVTLDRKPVGQLVGIGRERMRRARRSCRPAGARARVGGAEPHRAQRRGARVHAALA